MKVPTERLREMLAACEGVTPGRRGYVHDEERDDYLIVCEPNDTPVGRMEAGLDAEFAAECDPATIRSALSELLELREAVPAPSNPAEVGALTRRGPDFAFPMEDAPKDGTILRLLVKFDRKSAAGAFEDTTEPSWTIGANNKDNTGEDQWDIVGWSWEQDVFCHAYGATAMGWLPFHTESNEPSALASPPTGDTGGAFRQGIEAAAAVAKYGMDRAHRDYRTESPGSHAYRMAEEIHDAILALVPARVDAVDHIADAGKMVDGWQSIETAPKDGTRFLVYSTRNGSHDLLRWIEGRDGYADHFVSMLGYGGIPIAFVTHWHPLPPAPALQANPS